MTEEEKALWKIKVFRECEATDDRVNEVLKGVTQERLDIQQTI